MVRRISSNMELYRVSELSVTAIFAHLYHSLRSWGLLTPLSRAVLSNRNIM